LKRIGYLQLPAPLHKIMITGKLNSLLFEEEENKFTPRA